MTIKDLIIFCTGVTVGSLAGFVIGRRVTEKRAEQRIDEIAKEYEALNPYARKEHEEEDLVENGGKIDKSSIQKMEPKERTPYHKYFNTDPEKLQDPAFLEHPLDQGEDGEEEEPTPEEIATEQHREDFDKLPEQVSESNLDSVPEWYDTKTLFYYVYDEVFTDEDDNEIRETILLIGDEFVNSNFMEDDTPIAYIRNYQQDTLYEIQKIWASYNDKMEF